MDSLTLNINKAEIMNLMRDFNLLTGIKIALFDPYGKEILSYPKQHCPFCSYIRSIEEGENSDQRQYLCNKKYYRNSDQDRYSGFFL